MHVSHLLLLPLTIVLAFPLEKRAGTDGVVDVVTAVLPTGLNGLGGTVFAGAPNQLGTANDIVKTVFSGVPSQLGTGKDIITSTTESVLPAGAPGTIGTLFTGLKSLLG